MGEIGCVIRHLIRETDEDGDIDDQTLEGIITWLISDEVGVTKEKHLHLLTMQELPPFLNIVKKKLVLKAFIPKAELKDQQVPPRPSNEPVNRIPSPIQGIHGMNFHQSMTVSPLKENRKTVEVSQSFSFSLSPDGHQRSPLHDTSTISLSSNVLMNTSIIRADSSDSNDSRSSISKSKDFGTIEQYFKPEDWAEMGDYEKRRFLNMYNLYNEALLTGVPAAKPAFMKHNYWPAPKNHSREKKTREQEKPTRFSERLKNGSPRNYREGLDDDGVELDAGSNTGPDAQALDDEKSNDSADSMLDEDRKRIRLLGQCLVYKTPLPEFGEMAKQNLLKPAHERNMSPILSDCLAFIKKQTGGTYLTKQEYDDFSRTMVEKYPALSAANATQPWVIFKKSLSASIRGRRARKRKAKGGKSKPNKAKKSQTRQQSPDEAGPSNVPSVAATGFIYSPKLQELKGERNVRKILALLKATENERRGVADKIPHLELIEQFPYLKMPDMVLMDFISSKKQTKDELAHLTKINFEKLQKYFDVEGMGEVSQLRVVEKLHDHFITPVVKKRGAKPVFQIVDKEEVFVALQSSEDQAPFVVVYCTYCDFSEEEVIKSAAVMMKGRLLFSIDGQNLTAFRLCLLLLAVYATFNIEYPRPYMEFLRALERFLTGSCAPSKYGNTKAKFNRLMSAVDSKSKECE